MLRHWFGCSGVITLHRSTQLSPSLLALTPSTGCGELLKSDELNLRRCKGSCRESLVGLVTLEAYRDMTGI